MKKGLKGILGLAVIVGAFLLGGEMDYRDQVNETTLRVKAETEAKHSCKAAKAWVSAFKKTCAVNLIGER